MYLGVLSCTWGSFSHLTYLAVLAGPSVRRGLDWERNLSPMGLDPQGRVWSITSITNMARPTESMMSSLACW